VGLGVFDDTAVLGGLEGGVVGHRVGKGPGQLAVEDVEVDEAVGGADDVAPLVLGGAEIALGVQFLPGPGGLVGVGEGGEVVAGATGGTGLGHHLGGHPAGLHGGVDALVPGAG